ncbi:DUF2785 domain-containing protein [Bacillus sp. CGMCC 1.16607]|uniref:DUF2785 domain-containing protein n=1 Tax=Bacillus sp. CGMCC 1.16607 TaxID=3351842 RepID=UPI00363840C4
MANHIINTLGKGVTIKNMELKLQLKQLRNKDIQQLSAEYFESLIGDMLENIGSVDPELRDKLIYPTFIWLINESLLLDKQYQYILETCLDENHLFYGVGERNTDSVFTRSFSSLVITGLLSKDRQTGVLSEDNLKNAFERSINYLQNELDTRGYVKEKGWAHSIAHGADLLVSLVRHPKISEKNFTKILNIVHTCLFKDATYIDDEDERLIFVIEALIERNLDELELELWVLQIFTDLELIYTKEGFSNEYFQTKFNTTNFLKALYFRLGYKNNRSNVRDLINGNLKELHQKVYGS